MKMKYDIVSLMRHGGDALANDQDAIHIGYALHEAANNMIVLMRGEATIEEFQEIYTGGRNELVDLDERFPVDDEKEGGA